MITPISTMTIDQICERKDDLLVGSDDVKELAKNERNKAVDEFAEKLIAHFDDWLYQEAPCNDDETDRTRNIICDTICDAIGRISEIAEKMKGE